MDRKLSPIMSNPRAEAWGSSCAPAMSAVKNPQTRAAATVQPSVGSRSQDGIQWIAARNSRNPAIMPIALRAILNAEPRSESPPVHGPLRTTYPDLRNRDNAGDVAGYFQCADPK